MNKLTTLYKEYENAYEKYLNKKEALSKEMDKLLYEDIGNNKKLKLYYCLLKALHRGITTYLLDIKGFENTQISKEKCQKYFNFLYKILKGKNNKIIKLKVSDHRTNDVYKFEITEEGIRIKTPELFIPYKEFEYYDALISYIFEELKPLRISIKKSQKNNLSAKLSAVENWAKENKLKMSLVGFSKTYETVYSMTGCGTGRYRTDCYGCIKIKYKNTIYYINHSMITLNVFYGTLQEVINRIKKECSGELLVCANSLSGEYTISRESFINDFKNYEIRLINI